MSLPVLKPTVANGESEPAVRPKVLRRPAQFSSSPAGSTASPSHPPTALLVPLSAPAPTAPIMRSWQEDSRFGVALIGLVVVVNIVLMLWLPNVVIHPKISGVSARTVALRESIGPISNSAITLYTQPLPPALNPANLHEPDLDTIILPRRAMMSADTQAR